MDADDDPHERISGERMGRALVVARLSAGYSQRGLGLRAGLSQSTISRIETGKLRTMRFRTLLRLLGALDVVNVQFVVEPRPWWRVR